VLEPNEEVDQPNAQQVSVGTASAKAATSGHASTDAFASTRLSNDVGGQQRPTEMYPPTCVLPDISHILQYGSESALSGQYSCGTSGADAQPQPFREAALPAAPLSSAAQSTTSYAGTGCGASTAGLGLRASSASTGTRQGNASTGTRQEGIVEPEMRSNASTSTRQDGPAEPMVCSRRRPREGSSVEELSVEERSAGFRAPGSRPGQKPR
jgi:hypothetical protein